MEQLPHDETLQAEVPDAAQVPTEAGVPGQQELAGTENGEARQYKTLGIRVDNELHAKLSFISQLRENSLQGEIVQAIRDRVEAAQQDEELIEKAAAVREQIEREARARQEAIAGMFGSIAVSAAVDRPAKPGSRRGHRGSGSAAGQGSDQ